MTVVIVALVAIPLLVAITTIVTSTVTLDDRAESDNVMTEIADRVNRVVTTSGCWSASKYRNEVASVLAERGWTGAMAVEVSHRLPADDVGLVGPWIGSACPSATTPPDGYLQLVSITVTSPRGQARTLQVVKGVI
jgi:hypothetical protein